MIEVIIPDQPNQTYPEAVLRSLVRDGKVQPDWAARTVGSASWSSIHALLNPAENTVTAADNPDTVSRTSESSRGKNNPSSLTNHPFEGQITQRYAHGQSLVNGLAAKAESLEILGKVGAFLITIICATIPAMLIHNASGSVIACGLIGLVLGLLVYKILESRATMLRLQASLLAATIDMAVYACPYLSDTARLSLICAKET
jgi:hypothetical protein